MGKASDRSKKREIDASGAVDYCGFGLNKRIGSVLLDPLFFRFPWSTDDDRTIQVLPARKRFIIANIANDRFPIERLKAATNDDEGLTKLPF